MISYILNIFWPIKRDESKLFLLFALLIFFILLNYNLIYSLKESLIIPKLGAETVSFIDLWVIFPSMIFFSLTYLKLSLIIKSKNILFFIITSGFLLFFIIFGFFIYPNIEYIIPEQKKIEFLIDNLPNLKRFILIYSYWPLVLFNIFSELWVNVILSLLYWQYANDVIHTEQAKRFYPSLSIIGNFSLIICGGVLKKFSVNTDLNIIYIITSIISVIGILCIYLFKLIYNKTNNFHHIKEKVNLSFSESLKIIYKSKYIWLITLSLISYGVTINLSQCIWRSIISKSCPTTETYLLFMANYQQIVGVISVFFMLVGSYMIRHFSWLLSAITCPVVMLIFGIIFFLFLSYHNLVLLYVKEEDYLSLATIIGTLHIIFSKSTKYSLADSTKELAYIPLEKNLKDKGKAAADLLGERLGKSISAFIQSGLFILFPYASYESLSPIFFIIFLFFVVSWILAIKSLNQLIDEKKLPNNN